MKKAKIMLMALTVLAVVGGSLAFKANRFTRHTLYYATTSTAACNIVTNTFLTLSPVSTAIGQQKTFYTTTALIAPCPPIYTITAP
jgi:hypothetical protein